MGNHRGETLCFFHHFVAYLYRSIVLLDSISFEQCTDESN